MYGLWLFKEIRTEYGYCKVDIYRKAFTGSAIEIGGFVGDSLSIALENLDTITAPVGKSVCSFAIYDTEQVEYDDLFSPDATAFKVVVSTRVGSGAYVTRWSGYVTPDFFAENLSYRTPISISARDNIGYLNDVDFDLTATTVTVRELIQSAFRKIAEDYPMSLSFVTQKQTAEGILAIDATISTTLLREMSWGEALENILHDLGLQMRWVDNNTIAVLDLSQIPEYYATQGFNFVDASGYREIAPAWRQLSQEQNYGVRENFYEGQIDQEAKLEYVTTSQISTNILLYQPIALTQWRREGAIYLLNFFNGYNFDVDDNKAESIYITGVGSNATITDVLATKMVYSQRVTQVDKQMKFTFNLNDTLREPRATSYNRGEADSIFYLPYSQQSGLTTAPIPRPYQLKFRFNVFLRAEDGSEYVMREEWVNANTTITEQPFIEFKTKKLEVYNSGVNDAQGNPRVRYTSYDNEEEFSITIGSIPKAGILEFVVYPYTFVDDEYASVRDDATFQRGAKISDITFAIKDTATGIESNTLVDAQHNVKNAVSYSFGEVPIKNGDFLLYAGGLFNPVNLTALKGYQRNADATNYNLLELVGRELIHFNKKNYNRLSGTIRNLNKEPLMFNRLFVREGKKYAPYNYSLNVISNEMNITSMQEVEPYETAIFNTIDSQITTGGGTVSGGNNTILQYSEEAGNEKRLYELQTATEQEVSDAYVLVDKAGFPEARKVHISELGGFDVRELEQYLESNGYATLKRIWEVDSTNAVVRTTYNVVSEQEIISCRRASGSGSGGGGGISEITAQMVVDALGYVPYSSLNPAGYITSAAIPTALKNPYALTINGHTYDGSEAVNITISAGGGVADSVDWVNVTNKPTTLGGYGITDALSTSGGTITGKLVICGLGYKSDASTVKITDTAFFQIGAIEKDNDALYIGQNSSSTIWLQNAYGGADGLPSHDFTYPICLQPIGGNVGVGVMSPQYKFDVDGTARFANKGSSDVPLVLESSIDTAWISFITGSTKQYFGASADNRLLFQYNANLYDILHSGNYSNYALPLSGGIMKGNIDISNHRIILGYSVIEMGQGMLGAFTESTPTTLYWYDTIDWREIINDGNIAGYAPIYNTDGNVLIDTLSDHGGKIQVTGGAKFYIGAQDNHTDTANLTGSKTFSILYSEDNRFGLNLWLNNNGSVTFQPSYFNSGTDDTYNLNLCPLGGNVGVGTSLPYSKFEVAGNIAEPNATNVASSAMLSVNKHEDDGVFIGFGATTKGWIQSAYYGRENVTSTAHAYRLWLNPLGGDVYIGNGNHRLYVSGNLIATGEVISSRRASSSDARLKDNINRLIAEDCLAMVRKLQPSSWDWKENGEHSMGFIAQDIEPMMPYAVTRIKDDILGQRLNLQYDQFFAPVVGAIQCLDSEVEQLKKRVKYLENKLQEYGYNRY